MLLDPSPFLGARAEFLVPFWVLVLIGARLALLAGGFALDFAVFRVDPDIKRAKLMLALALHS